MAHTYRTIGADLVEHAEIAAKYFNSHGYKIKREFYEVDFPYTATLHCSRGHTNLLVDVDDRIRIRRLQLWSAYAQSRSVDTRIGLVIPPTALKIAAEDKVRSLKVGLYVSKDATLMVRCAPSDLALRATVPDLASLSPKLRKLFGSPFEKFAGEDWREGFEEAAQVVETAARDYLQRNLQRTLKSGLTAGRIVVLDKTGKPRTFKPGQIDGMTMGQLKDAFGNIQTQTLHDSIIYEVLEKVNPDRIGVVHKRATKAAEQRLRANVGPHMWRLVTAIRAITGEAP